MKTRRFVTVFTGVPLALLLIVTSISASSTAWTQVNFDGFGNIQNKQIYALEPFGDHLYAGTSNTDSGAQLWRSPEGDSWSQVAADGFGTGSNNSVSDLQEYNGYLYAGTANFSTGGEVWRSSSAILYMLEPKMCLSALEYGLRQMALIGLKTMWMVLGTQIIARPWHLQFSILIFMPGRGIPQTEQNYGRQMDLPGHPQ
jgi:hypothetical protein